MEKFVANIAGLTVGPGAPVRIMGVINLSPESFYKGSIPETTDAQDRISRFVSEKADIIDFGAKSTAPLSVYGQPTYVTPEEEINRLEFPLNRVLDLKSRV
ncbi:MAG TPA: dihydropteroate synthase, partial [Candidatus Hodarchaeales archaeon]|nr:dihydropteroate synthase [Candidatus Hodarchaeales archaeon]